MLLGTLIASLLENLLSRKRIIRAGDGKGERHHLLKDMFRMNLNLKAFIQEIIYQISRRIVITYKS